MLEVWDARTFIGVMEKGSSRPIRWRCVCTEVGKSQEPEVFIVKGFGHPKVSESHLFAEALGHLLARYFGVRCPRSVLVQLSPQLLAQCMKVPNTVRSLKENGIQLQPGYCIGAQEWEAGTSEFMPGMQIHGEMIEQAKCIYAYDLLVMNGDRHPQNPNCAVKNDSLLAYDFGLAFGFTQIEQPLSACEVNCTNLGPQHLFYAALKNCSPDWSEFVPKLESITEKQLIEMTKNFPEKWLSLRPRIFNYLLDARDKANTFRGVLEESLQ